MPFLRSSTRPVAVECFFCLSPSLLPPEPTTPRDRKGKGKAGVSPAGTRWNWRCERCGCWNIKDELTGKSGEMISDIPAMHDPSLNTESFSHRATPSSSRLPSGTTRNPFCHNCQANQTLIMNMLANYLPDDHVLLALYNLSSDAHVQDPSFPSLYADLPSYLASLHARYPPVCQECQPAVEEALRRSDQRAQVEAWGSALNRGATHARAAESSGEPAGLRLWLWRLKGVLWVGQLALNIAACLATCHLVDLTPAFATDQPMLAALALLTIDLLSIWWIAWDPFEYRRELLGVKARRSLQRAWKRNMAALWLSRLAFALSLLYWTVRQPNARIHRLAAIAALSSESIILFHAFFAQKASRPIQISLVRPAQPHVSFTSTPHRSSTHASKTQTGISQDGLSELVLSHRASNPIFGETSWKPKTDIADGPEPMDWEPSPSSRRRPLATTQQDDQEVDEITPPRKSDWDAFATNRQRMYPQKTEETGLESLLAGWGIRERAARETNIRRQKGWFW